MITKFQKIKKRGGYTVLLGKVGLVCLVLIIIGFLAISNFRINQKRRAVNFRAENLKKEIQILELKNQELKAGIFQTITEDFLEREARERFHLKKPGEEVVVILRPEEKTNEAEDKKRKWLAPLEALLRKIF